MWVNTKNNTAQGVSEQTDDGRVRGAKLGLQT